MKRRLLAGLVIIIAALGLLSQPLMGARLTRHWTEYARLDIQKALPGSSAARTESNAVLRHDREGVRQGEVEPQGDDPGVGATQVVIDRWSSGYTYQDDEKSGTASFIWNVAMKILSYFLTTAGNIMLDIAALFGDSVDQSKGATSRLYHSYSYPDKLAQVWTESSIWETYYTSRNREWYRHEYASYVNTLGYTHSATRDYTPDEGGSAIKVDWAPHYSSNTWLRNEAWELWYLGYDPGFEDWTD